MSEFAHEPFKSNISLDDMVLLDVSPIGFQSWIFWELILLVQVPRVEVSNVGHKPLAPQGAVLYL